jgi:putative ABC transport system ATP-binding protein
MLRVEALGHAYGGRSVLDVARWEVPGGARRAVAGPSGSGKTTLLAILAGLVRPGRGSVHVAGTEVSALAPAALDRWRAGNVGVVMQTPHLLGPLDACENVTAAQYLAGTKPDRRQAAALLEQLGIGTRAGAKPHQLSRGEQQRVAIARAVINRPKLLLADEPTANLDDASCDAVLDLFERAAGDAIFIVATHDARVKARYPERLELGRAT